MDLDTFVFSRNKNTYCSKPTLRSFEKLLRTPNDGIQIQNIFINQLLKRIL